MTKHSTKSPEVNSRQKQKAQEITSTCETVKVSIPPLCNLPAATRHYAALHQIVFFSTKTTKCNDILNVKFIHSSRLESHQHEHTCTVTPLSAPSQRAPLIDFSAELLSQITTEAITYSLVIFSHSLPLISQCFVEHN